MNRDYIKVWNILYSLKDEDGSYKWISFQKGKKERMPLRQRHALVRKGASEDAIWEIEEPRNAESLYYYAIEKISFNFVGLILRTNVSDSY